MRPERQNPTTTEIPFKRLTDKEVVEKKAKNECFCCNEKFHPRHKCKKGQFHIIERIPHEESYSIEDEADDEGGLREEQPIIFVHALTGIPSHMTMMVRGIIGRSKRVIILIDSGSTHNFLNESWVAEMDQQ